MQSVTPEREPEEDSYIDVSHASTAYVAGFVVKRVLNDGSCNICEHLLVTSYPLP